MTNIQSVGNNNLEKSQLQLVEKMPKNVKKLSFKAENDQFIRQNRGPVYTQPPILDPRAQIKNMEKAQKKEKNRNLLNTVAAISGIAVAAAIVYSVFGGRGASKELLKMIDNCRIPEIKKAAMAEYNKGPQMCSEKKIKDLLSLANASSKKPGMVDLEKAIRIMDEKIVDMPEVKESVLDFLIEYNVNISKGIKNKKPLVLAIDGPAGTGKTTISEVIAEAIGIPYKKIAMGGATGKSVIRGTESHFVGAEAGNIARGQIDNGSNRVLYLLDEVDKLGKSEQHGSVESALLSLFDDQAKFTDDFLGAELDLSESIFILTTNEFKKLSTPLQNRVKLIKIAPYNTDTKTKIARMHLNRELKEAKIDDLVEINENTYKQIAELTNDEGGRETTRHVKELIRQINTMIGLGEMPTNKLKIDADFVKEHLNFSNKTKTTKQRIMEAIKEGRLLKEAEQATTMISGK